MASDGVELTRAGVSLAALVSKKIMEKPAMGFMHKRWSY
jgi:hypothetical protein